MSENSFFHKEYDPVKAHNYYMEVRKLKGKQGKGKPPPVHKKSSGSTSSSSGRRAPGKAQMATKSPKQLRADAEARVASIRVRLGKLTAHLDELLKSAESSTGKKKTDSSTSKSSSSSSQSSSDLTAAQKQQKKAADKKYYDEHKKPEASKPTAKERDAEIARVRAQIVQVRAQLKAAIQRARQATSSKTTVQGR